MTHARQPAALAQPLYGSSQLETWSVLYMQCPGRSASKQHRPQGASEASHQTTKGGASEPPSGRSSTGACIKERSINLLEAASQSAVQRINFASTINFQEHVQRGGQFCMPLGEAFGGNSCQTLEGTDVRDSLRLRPLVHDRDLATFPGSNCSPSAADHTWPKFALLASASHIWAIQPRYIQAK